MNETNQAYKIQQGVIRSANTIFKPYPVLFAYLYGSYASGITHRFSDLDIGVFIEPASLERSLDIELALSLEVDKALNHIVGSDARTINSMPISFTGPLLTEGMLIYSRNEEERIGFETRTRIAYFDFLPVLQNYQRYYIQSALGI